ncbi:zinc-ribbon domain-containing protein [Roseovarius sp. CAU 1744]|uniref:zinc-ribbon domain-containing protein n=1 Tax=Roseovarius sp. CAU 1744 TaxID=3140368 RepID=UPI00325A85EC
MRLTCPNCGAQYEVPDEVIPETGRDVQCSNCGDTWFQLHPSQQTAEETEAAEKPHPGWDSPEDEPEEEFAPEEEEPASDEVEEPEVEIEDDRAPEPETEPEEEAAAPEATDMDEPVDEEGDDEEPEAHDDMPEPAIEEAPDTPPGRGLDPSIVDVLREEAAREEEARAAEGSGLETQPDLGLDGPSGEEEQRSREARSRMARMRGLPEEDVAEADEPELDPGLISRRNLLPDIDEINSSLDSESVRAENGQGDGGGAGGEAATAGKSSFGRGFTRAVLLVLILVLLYLLAPMIAENVPALEGVLKTYVDTVNAGRIWLNDWIGSMVSSG